MRKKKEMSPFGYPILQRLAGGQPISFNNAVFMSEREDADRNYALAYYMRENHCFPDGTDLNACLDLYFQVRSSSTALERSF
jgi:glutaminase